MITLILGIIYLIVLIVCCILSLLFIALAIVWRKKKTRVAIFSTLGTVFIIATYFVWTNNPLIAETTDREKGAVVFEEDFGFKPPNAIKEIKVKNYTIYDSSVHWIAFTYDPTAFNKVVRHDAPLDIAYLGTQKYREIDSTLKDGCGNCPGWLELPNNNAPKIFFKKDFLKDNSSEYYLWADTAEKMVYLEVSYF